jgi:hypothetical protein
LVQIHFQTVNPLIITLKIDLPAKKYANPLAISLCQSTTNRQETVRNRQQVVRIGYKIYSVDAEGHDDGGRERPVSKKPGDKQTYDITFIVER